MVINSVKIFKLTKIIIVESISLRCSPLRTFVNFAPICTQATEPNNNKVAKTMSTV